MHSSIGFSNESMITIATLFLVIGAVEKSHIVDWLARKTFGTNGEAWVGRLRMYITCFFLSIFFNNTPLVAILLPVVKDWGRMRGIAASQLLIPLSFAVLAGSFGSMIGTSTNLTVQGLMEVDRGYSFPFFAPLPIGIVCFAALLIYMTIAGPFLLPNDKSGLLRKARDELKEYIAEVYVSHHSQSVGKTLDYLMNSIGVAPSLAVKIRRRGSPVDRNSVDENRDSIRPSRSFSSFLDVEYLKESAKYWYDKPNIPDRLGEYTAAGTSEEEASNSSLPTANPSDPENASSGYFDIISPSFHEIIQAGDVIFIASAQDAVEKMMKSILGESRGLYILKGNVMSLPGFGSELVELVVSDSNPFLGKKVSEISADFGEFYKAALITVRPKDFGSLLANSALYQDQSPDQPSKETALTIGEGVAIEMVVVSAAKREVAEEESKDEQEKRFEEDLSRKAKALHAEVVISDHVLRYGDTLLAVTNKKNVEELSHNRDFFIVSSVGKLSKPLDWYTMIPVGVFIAMLICVASEIIDMCPAALTVTAFFFMGGWIKPQEIPKLVDVRLLMLMGTSLSFARAMTKSGLALKIAATINDSNPDSYGALMLIYVITLVITELISNNAAAALMYPIAVALADELGVSFKPFAMAVLVASTAGFMSPIGYQTHVMVWGPGGYSFRDFVIFGLIPDIIYWVLGCALAVQLYPF